jgi:NAD(P)-dependent dehydrogenase (short-subunit alcohol dehydrogenase family)
MLPHLDGLGAVDILVVAMGPIAYRSLAETDDSTWQQMVDLNLVLPGLLVSRYLPAMVAAGWGRIVLFGGPHGDTLRGFRTIAAYGAAKAGLASLCKSASQQTDGQNVAVNVIAPGYVDTEYLSPVQRKNLSAKAPRGTLIPPERVARLVNQLILAEEPDMNGAVITLDQGLA